MKKLIRYLKNYKKESVLGPLFKLLEVVFELMVPMIMASLIDKGIGNRDEVYIGKMFGMLILLGLLGLASSVTAQYFAAKAATGFAKDVKKKGEAAKVAIRNIRRDANDTFKKMNKANELTEDDQKDLETKLQKMTDKFVADIDKAVDAKTKDIMKV